MPENKPYILKIIMEKADHDLSKEIALLKEKDDPGRIEADICEQCIKIV
jgi:hypothetical protein